MRVLFLFTLITLVGATGCAKDEEKQQGKGDPLKGVKFDKAPEPAPVAQQQPAGAQDNQPKQKGPKSLLGNIRGKALRTERQQELRTIAQFFGAMATPPRTLDAFKSEFKVQANPIYKAIDEGYYTINLKARQFSQDILAYETDSDSGYLHYYATASGTVDAMRTDELKKALMPD